MLLLLHVLAGMNTLPYTAVSVLLVLQSSFLCVPTVLLENYPYPPAFSIANLWATWPVFLLLSSIQIAADNATAGQFNSRRKYYFCRGYTLPPIFSKVKCNQTWTYLLSAFEGVILTNF